MLQKQKGSLDNYCIEGRCGKPLSKRDRELTFSNGVPVWGSHGLSTYETGTIIAKGPARKKDTHTVQARSRAWLHDGGRQRSWVPASQWCGSRSSNDSRQRTVQHLRSSRSARLPRKPDATGMPSCESGDSSEHLLHLTISNREANVDPRTRVVVVLGLHSAAAIQPLHAANTQTVLAMFIKDLYDRFSHIEVSAFISGMHLRSATPLHGNRMWNSWTR